MDHPLCPKCGKPARLKGRVLPVEGLSYDAYALWCAECGAALGFLWHTEMLRSFAERAVNMVLEVLLPQRSTIFGEAGDAVD